MKKKIRAAILLGGISALSIFRLHGRLIPDFYSYSHGGSEWSSVATATTGHLGGQIAVQVLSVAAATICGWLVGNSIIVLLIAISPIGQGINNAGADAIGAAVLTITIDKTYGASVFSSLAHLVSGLSAIVGMAFKLANLPTFLGVTLGGIGAITGEWMLSILLNKHFSGIQWRYLLPAAIYTAKNRYRLFGD